MDASCRISWEKKTNDNDGKLIAGVVDTEPYYSSAASIFE